MLFDVLPFDVSPSTHSSSTCLSPFNTLPTGIDVSPFQVDVLPFPLMHPLHSGTRHVFAHPLILDPSTTLVHDSHMSALNAYAGRLGPRPAPLTRAQDTIVTYAHTHAHAHTFPPTFIYARTCIVYLLGKLFPLVLCLC
jgi:hypothetical protein